MSTNYIKKTDSKGRNLHRVCYVTGHGLRNHRFESFWQFFKTQELEGTSAQAAKIRTKLFQDADEANYEGYHIRMVYRVDDIA